VSIETRRKAIQHQSGGVVKKVMVKEGQWVKEGEVMLEIDDTYAKANVDSIKPTLYALQAAEARLHAELQGSGNIKFPQELMALKNDMHVKNLMLTQQALFNSRRNATASDLAALNESLSGLRAQKNGLVEVIRARSMQAELQSRHLQSIKGLSSEGYAPVNQVLQMEQSQADLKASMSDLLANQQRVNNAIAEAEQRLAQRKQEYIKENTTQLSDISRDAQPAYEKLKAALEELDRTKIRTPVSGQVINLAISAVGGVVAGSQKIMDIVPKDELLLIEARIPPNLIDKVQAGMFADVRFTTFSNAPQLVVQGKLVSIGADATPEQASANPMASQNAYLARIEITPEGIHTLGGRVMQAGMPTEVLIKTGERSMLKYLLNPLTKRIAAAMKEE
jgi:protease secretion system membrane fusion protein